MYHGLARRDLPASSVCGCGRSLTAVRWADGTMNADFSTADSRLLHEPFTTRLATIGPRATLNWLLDVLATQAPTLRSSNAFLVAYTGCDEAIDWLERCVDSPVMDAWGRAAALLGTPWPRLAD